MEKSILVVAGEVSGDLHASRVVKACRERYSEVDFWGIGGDHLGEQGVELLQHTDRMSVMGIAEVLKQYRFFKRVMRQVLEEVDRRRPESALLVDYPGFNLRLAAELKKRGVRVFYYISPKVWVWNKRRIPKMAKAIDRLMVVFPFEVEVFEGSGLQVDYVGNPLVEQIDAFLETVMTDLPWHTDRRIALLPGSRRQEIERILPTILSAAKLMEEKQADLSFLIATPNERIETLVNETVLAIPDRPSRLNVVCGHAREAMRQADAAIVTSGTATLETALLGTPHVLVYKTSPFTYWFARSVVRVRHIGLVNLIAGRSVTPEILQDDASPQRLADETLKLVSETAEHAAMIEGFAEVRRLLGAEHAARNVVKILIEA